MFDALFNPARKRRRANASALYRAIVAQARQPVFYSKAGVPDSLDGRYELIAAHLTLFVDRLRRAGDEGETLAGMIYDVFLEDMDIALREAGVGDLSVGKQIKVIVEGLNGRMVAYPSALAAGDIAALREALSRNLFGTLPTAEADANAAAMVAYWQAYWELLETKEDMRLVAGELTFPPLTLLEVEPSHAG